MKEFESKTPPHDVFDVKDASDFARVSVAKIEQWVREGLPHIRTGVKFGDHGPAGIIILREDLIAFLKSKRERHEGKAPLAGAKRGRKPKAKADASGGNRVWVKLDD